MQNKNSIFVFFRRDDTLLSCSPCWGNTKQGLTGLKVEVFMNDNHWKMTLTDPWEGSIPSPARTLTCLSSAMINNGQFWFYQTKYLKSWCLPWNLDLWKGKITLCERSDCWLDWCCWGTQVIAINSRAEYHIIIITIIIIIPVRQCSLFAKRRERKDQVFW